MESLVRVGMMYSCPLEMYTLLGELVVISNSPVLLECYYRIAFSYMRIVLTRIHPVRHRRTTCPSPDLHR